MCGYWFCVYIKDETTEYKPVLDATDTYNFDNMKKEMDVVNKSISTNNVNKLEHSVKNMSISNPK